MSLVGCEAFSSAENLDTEGGSGNGAHTETHAPLPGPTASLPMVVSAIASQLGEAGTTQKSLHNKKVPNISFSLLGSLSPAGVGGENPLWLQDTETIAAALYARRAQGVCSLIIFQHKPGDKVTSDEAMMG